MIININENSDIIDYISSGFPLGDCWIISRNKAFGTSENVFSSKPTVYDYKVYKDEQILQINFEEDAGDNNMYQATSKKFLYIKLDRSVSNENVENLIDGVYDISIEFEQNEIIYSNVSYIFNIKKDVFGNDFSFENFKYSERQVKSESKHYESGEISNSNININVDCLVGKSKPEINLDCLAAYDNLIEYMNDSKLNSNHFCVNGCIKTYNK